MKVYAKIEKWTVSAIEINDFEYKKVVISKAFTTERKKRKTSIDICRKGSIVRERCKQLVEILAELYSDGIINDEDLAFWISKYIGGNRDTIRAYMGYNGIVQRSKKTGEGYVRGTPRKGYLEIFGFMHRIKPNEWFIHHQTILPKFGETVSNTNEGISENSKEKISLSHKHSPDNENLQLTAVKEEVSVGETSVSPRTERLQRNDKRGDMGGR